MNETNASAVGTQSGPVSAIPSLPSLYGDDLEFLTGLAVGPFSYVTLWRTKRTMVYGMGEWCGMEATEWPCWTAVRS